MLLLEQKLLLGNIFKATNLTYGLTFSWDSEQGRARSRSRNAIKRNTACCYLHSLVFWTSAAQWIHSRLKRERFSSIASVQIGYIIGCQLLATIAIWECRKSGAGIVSLINSLLDLHAKYDKGNKTGGARRRSLVEKLCVLLAHGLLFTITVVPPVAIYAFHWRDPCRPSLAGNWILEKCGGAGRILSCSRPGGETWLGGGGDRAAEWLILGLNHWALSFGFHVLNFTVSGLHVLTTISVRDCLLIIRELHFQRKVSVWAWVKLLRYIQHIGQMLNEIQQPLFMPCTLCAMTVLSLVSTALVRMPWNLSHIFEITAFSVLLVDMVLILLVLSGGMVGLFVESKKLLGRMRRVEEAGGVRGSSLERRYIQRIANSWPPIKVNFTKLNWLEEATPLKFIDSAIVLTVNLLLLSGNK